MQPVSEQQLGKHVPAETNTHTTIEERCSRFGPRRGVTLKTVKLTGSVEDWQLRRALQGRLRRDGAIVELTVDKSSVARYSPDINDFRAAS
jgi:hypothetical protein